MFFFVVPCPIHWLNAYANASARLRGLERVPTPEVFNTRCLRRCLRGVLCWMAMLLVTKYFPKRFTVGALHATLDLASFVLVSVAFLGRWSRCLRAASAEPTRAYAVEPRQIPRNHLSYSYKFICITSCTYSGNYIYIYLHKQASWQFTYIFTSWKCKWTSAYATCLREKNLDCLRGCLRTPTRTVKYQVNSLRSCIRSSLEYMRLVIQKECCSYE